MGVYTTVKAFMSVWDIVFSQRFLCEGQSREGKLLKGLRRSNLNTNSESEISTLTYCMYLTKTSLTLRSLFDHNDMNSQRFFFKIGHKVVTTFTISVRGPFWLHCLTVLMSNHLI